MIKTAGVKYNEKTGKAESSKYRGQYATGWCGAAATCSSYPRYCDGCILINGKRTMYEPKEQP